MPFAIWASLAAKPRTLPHASSPEPQLAIDPNQSFSGPASEASPLATRYTTRVVYRVANDDARAWSSLGFKADAPELCMRPFD
jgi:hypothetical protein